MISGTTANPFTASTTYNQYVRTISAIASGSSLVSGDDAADVAVDGDLSAQVNQLNAVSGNIQDVVSLAQTQQGFLQGIQSQLTQLSVVAQEASSNVLGSSAQQAYSSEFDDLVGQINQVAGNATFNGVPLFSGQTVPVSVDAGGAFDSFVLSTVGNASSLGLSGASVDTPANAANALNLVDSALSCVGNQIATVAADVSKFNFYISNAGTEQANLTSADSSISAADIAQQSTNLSTESILNQAADAVQAQANHDSKYVLNLLTPLANTA